MSAKHKWLYIITIIITHYNYHELLQIYIKHCGVNEQRTGNNQEESPRRGKRRIQVQVNKPLPGLFNPHLFFFFFKHILKVLFTIFYIPSLFTIFDDV